MSGKLDWSEWSSWGNQPPTHASLRPSPSKKLVACTERQTHIYLCTCKQFHTLTSLKEFSRGRRGGGRLHFDRLIQELSPGRFRYRVWPQASMCVCLCTCVCVCAQESVCLKSNDDFTPTEIWEKNRVVCKLELSHPFEVPEMKASAGSHHRHHLALNSWFWR